MSDCKHGLEEAWCSHCQGTPDQLPATAEGPTIAARFHGRCTVGDDTIYPGEDITQTDQGWAHATCLK